MLAVLLPTLKVRFGLSETLLALLVATLSFSSSVTQPLFGNLVDRFGRRLMATLGIAISSVLLSLIAVAPSPLWLVVILFFGGLGSSAFHPAGTGIARMLGGPRAGLAVSLFSSAGTFGIALGPLVIGWLLMNNALQFSPLLMVPGLLGALALYRYLPDDEPTALEVPRRNLLDFSLLRGPVGILVAAGILRSMTYTAFANGLPLWLVVQRGFASDAAVVFWSLSLFSLCAGIGGVVVGSLERHVPRVVLISGSMLGALLPLAGVFLFPPGTLAYFASVALAGALVNGGLPLMIVAGQDLAPHAMGSATGLLMGFTWGSAGVLYIGVGVLQELVGIQAAMLTSFSLLVPATVLASSVLRGR
jgi:FSR family fosmidomycin resistance protein-like MFS transporter